MAKIHTRVKRKASISKRRMERAGRKKRPKTFCTESAAHKWAETHKLKKGSYELAKAKKGKKFQVKKI